MKSRPKSSHAIRPSLLLSLVVTAMGGAAYLIPKEKELMNRFASDHNEQRLMDLSEANDSATKAQEATESQKVAAALEVIFSKYDFLKLSEPDADAINNIAAGTNHPAECWKVLQSTGRMDAVTPLHKRQLGENLATKALAIEKPCLASEIFRSTMYPIAECPQSYLETALKAFQFGNNHTDGDHTLVVLSELEKRRKFTLSEQILYTRLIREDGRAKEAYDRLRSLYDQVEDFGTKEQLFTELVSCINDAGHEAELPGLTMQLVEMMPAHKLSLEDLHKTAKSQTGEKHAELAQYAQRAFEYAQHCEWTGKFDNAMEYLLKSAVCGHADSLTRLQTLSEELGRQQDLLRLLRIILPISGRADLDLVLAKAEAQEGNYLAAEKQYRNFLAQSENDHDAWFQFASLQSELKRPQAVEAYRKAATLEPMMLEYHLGLAETLLQSGKFEAALDAYKAIPSGIHTIASLENYMLLAEALGHVQLTADVMTRLMELKDDPTAVDYRDLADVLFDAENPSQAVATLEAGLKRHPQSSILRCSLAEVHMNGKRYEEARKLLAQAALRTDTRAATLYIECCGELNSGGGLALLGPDFIERPWSPEILAQLAYLCELAGREEDTVKLFSKASKMGSKEAINALISLSDPNDSESLQRLGDVLRSLGQEKEAQEAYKKSLQIILTRTQTENAEEAAEAKKDASKEANATPIPSATLSPNIQPGSLMQVNP